MPPLLGSPPARGLSAGYEGELFNRGVGRFTDSRPTAVTRPPLGEFYEAQALEPGHPEHWAGPPEMVDEIATLLGTTSRHRVLDLGCGVGGPGRRLATLRGCRVVGIDLAPRVVEVARQLTHTPNMCFMTASALALPFPDAVFDQVWSLGVVAHIRDRGGMAFELERVLVPGGVVCFTEAFWDGQRRTRFSEVAPYPWEPLTPQRLIDALRAAGLREISMLPWPGRRLWRVEDVGDDLLRADFQEGRLVSRMVIARKNRASGGLS